MSPEGAKRSTASPGTQKTVRILTFVIAGSGPTQQPNTASPALQQVAHVRWLQLGGVTAAAAQRSQVCSHTAYNTVRSLPGD